MMLILLEDLQNLTAEKFVKISNQILSHEIVIVGISIKRVRETIEWLEKNKKNPKTKS